MITAWLIVQPRHIQTAFDGQGASQYPGRWNERGIPIVYTAESLSLAALEMLVHLPGPSILQRYQAIPVSFDEALCRQLSPADLSPDWADDPAPLSTRVLGSQWIADASSVVLAVPSAVVPIERIFLINPRHPDFPELTIGDLQHF
ncbi:MAG: RES domain-containing protein [Bacteroidota bacterium]